MPERLALELADLAERTARTAADLITAGPAVRSVAATKSSATDVVTDMDMAVERLIETELGRARPDDGLLGEEHGLRPGTSGITWVVDPIDGTVNYLYGLEGFAVSIAAVAGTPDPASWQVLAGCVLSVTDGRCWRGAAGAGSTVNGVPLTGPVERDLATSLVGTGFGYQVARRRGQGRVVARVLEASRDIRRRGVASADICTVAEGRLDVYYERGLNPWDMAAASVIATEAGVTVCGLRGGPATIEMTVAGRGQSLRELIALLEAADADSDDD